MADLKEIKVNEDIIGVISDSLVHKLVWGKEGISPMSAPLTQAVNDIEDAKTAIRELEAVRKAVNWYMIVYDEMKEDFDRTGCWFDDDIVALQARTIPAIITQAVFSFVSPIINMTVHTYVFN